MLSGTCGLGAGAASLAAGLLALDVASGVTTISDTSYDTEFIDMQLAWVAVVLVAAAAALSWVGGLVAAVLASIPQWWAMARAVARYDESGWSDGLEVLGYLYPILFTLVSLGTAFVGAALGRRRRHDQ
jgi:hypothetical protein